MVSWYERKVSYDRIESDYVSEVGGRAYNLNLAFTFLNVISKEDNCEIFEFMQVNIFHIYHRYLVVMDGIG